MFLPPYTPFAERNTDKSPLLQLTREYQNIQKNPPPFIIAHPSETNILEYGSFASLFLRLDCRLFC
jgi:hypothetical protein